MRGRVKRVQGLQVLRCHAHLVRRGIVPGVRAMISNTVLLRALGLLVCGEQPLALLFPL